MKLDLVGMVLPSHFVTVVLAVGLLLLAGHVDVRRRRRALHRESRDVWYFWMASEPTPAPLSLLQRQGWLYVAERSALALGTGLWILALLVVAARLVIAHLSA